MVDRRLVLVVLFVVTDDIVAVWIILVKRIVCCLLGTLLLFSHDIVRVEDGLMFAFLVESELLFARGVCLRGGQLDDSLCELFRLQVDRVACLLYLVNCSISTLAEQNMHHLTLQMSREHLINTRLLFGLIFVFEKLLVGWNEETCLCDGDLDQLEQ